jgi:hypothetical protein
VNFTWGLNVAVHGHSNRKMTYCDLNMSSGFGVEEDGPLSRALLLVLYAKAVSTRIARTKTTRWPAGSTSTLNCVVSLLPQNSCHMVAHTK